LYGLVVDDELLAHLPAQCAGEGAPQVVGHAARREADDHAHRLGRVRVGADRPGEEQAEDGGQQEDAEDLQDAHWGRSSWVDYPIVRSLGTRHIEIG